MGRRRLIRFIGRFGKRLALSSLVCVADDGTPRVSERRNSVLGSEGITLMASQLAVPTH